MTRILVTADLHFLADFAPAVRDGIYAEAESLAADRWQPDAVVVAGDLADMIRHPIGRDLREILRLLGDTFRAPVAFCAGNHDVWVRPDAADDSRVTYEQTLGAIAREEGVIFLDEQPLNLPDATIVGTMGHYDYTLAEPGLTVEGATVTREHYAAKMPPYHPMPVFNDARFIRWDMSDEEAVDRVCRRFEHQLETAVARGLPMLIATHTVPSHRLNGWTEQNRADAHEGGLFLSAFSGTTRLDRAIRERCADLAARVPIKAVSGHTHYRVDPFVETHIEWWNVGADYGEPRFDRVEV